jgi:hypothetical protein
MELNLERVRRNVGNADTEDLLDRATVYRADMEPAALEIIDNELVARGVTLEVVEAHLKDRQRVMSRKSGSVVKCSFCRRPAIKRAWSWHRLFRRIPIVPRRLAWCEMHLPKSMRE